MELPEKCPGAAPELPRVKPGGSSHGCWSGGSEAKALLKVKDLFFQSEVIKGNGNKLLNPLVLCVPQGFLVVLGIL